ncbi:hypothetical protein Hanom_Chr17g01574971 [Helianthus anomalus]
MSVRYRYGTVSVLYRILRVGIGIITIPYRTDTENAKKWTPIGIGIGTGSVWDRYGIGIRWHMLIPMATCMWCLIAGCLGLSLPVYRSAIKYCEVVGILKVKIKNKNKIDWDNYICYLVSGLEEGWQIVS